MGNEVYDYDFYKNRDAETRYSAKTILEIVKEYYNVRSICDLGCGVGTWLNVAKCVFDNTITISGFDGSYVNKELLVIPNNVFHAIDLNRSISDHYKMKKYDLAISLEVAEHLEPSRARGFISDLCDLSDVVLFSAATKLQGGDAHINEQRASYWINLFKEKEYRCIDIIRRRVWDNLKIQVWYRQNTFLFINKKKHINDELNRYEIQGPYIDVIHPDLYESKMKEAFINKLLASWYWLKDTGWNVSEPLRKRGIKSIAIYGIKGMGEIIYEDIVKNSKGEIEVKYFIDHYQKKHPDLEVYDYTDSIPEVDAIIVTPIHYMSDIYCYLEGRGSIIGIDELLKI